VIIYQDVDVTALETKVLQSHPPVTVLKKIYQCLANYYQLALGSGEGESFDFELYDFCDHFKLQVAEVYNALKKLEEEGLIEFNESFYSPSSVHFTADQQKLYEFQVANARFDPVIKMMLRLYGGQMFADFTKISESYLAKALKVSVEEMISLLKHLHEMKLVIYQAAKDSPQVTFVLPRQDADRLPLNIKRLEERKALAESKMKSMIEFTTSTHRCRMQLVQEYFGEETFETCGTCDVCIAKKKKENLKEIKELRKEIVVLLKAKLYTVEQLEQRIAPPDAELFIDVVRDMVEEGEIEYDSVWRLKIKNEK
jgi:ATP-dependent DNA helicase RecQ